MEHFIKQKSISELRYGIGILLSVLTIFGTFLLMYEYFFEPHYWKNRWRLNRYLNKGLVKVEYLRRGPFGRDIKIYNLKIEDSEYSLWIWNNQEMTLGDDYIGLFNNSLITRLLNRIAIKKIQKLAEQN